MKKLYSLLFLIAINFYGFSQSNQYLHFDGIDDYVEIENGVALLDGTTEITMSGWFYTDQLIYGAGMIGFRGEGEGDSMYLIQLSDGVIECRLIIGGNLYQVVAPAGSIQAETWQYVTWVYNGSSIELFIDGNSIGTASASGTFTGTTKPFGIGKSIAPGYNFIFKGRIDEVSLWGVALSQGEIQNIMNDELIGDESGLVAYYKFNQGIPEDDNTFITHLFSEAGGQETDALLHSFALEGTTSNFGGVLDPDFQVINFPIISNKVIFDDPFDLEAYTSSGLEVDYTVVSGPASVSGNTVTLDGVLGEVIIKASQDGNGTYNPAEDVFSSFQVLDPADVLPQITLTNPVPGDVFVPELGPILVSAKASIEFPDVFSIESVEVKIANETVVLTDYENGFYTGWWTPNSYGVKDIEVTGTNNYGNENIDNYAITIVDTAQDILVDAATDVWVYSNVFSAEVEATLPSYMGAYDSINATLIIACPTGGCDPWDRVSHIEVQGHDGKWHEIIRYITPYGVACDHEVDLTDFMSLLQGTVNFRFTLGTGGNGFLYSLVLDYNAGQPTYNYSTVSNLWSNTYAFGDLADLQPCENYEIDYADNVEAAKIKLVSTGHGWGSTNTGNAAEFHHDIHNVWVDGESTFVQDNWVICDPNPDGCNPQNGTWYYDRAGWCPGSIAQWFDYDLGTVNTATPMELNYIFDTDYIDYCHPNNPDCITGTTCSNCNEGFNPHLIVASHLVSFGDEPLLDNDIILSFNDFDNPFRENKFDFTVFPNPSTGRFIVDTYYELNSKIFIYNINGELITEINNRDIKKSHQVDISYAAKGIYFVKVVNDKGTSTKKVIVY